MKIEAVDFFYLAMPEITTEADGSQDALLVRVAAGGHVGWGECEASPLVSIAAFVCPMSHGVCRPVGASVLGQVIDGPGDIAPHGGSGRVRQHGSAAGCRIPGPASRWRSGTYSARRVASRSGGCSATTERTRRRRTPRSSSATRRSRRWNWRVSLGPEAFRLPSSAGVRSDAAPWKRTPTISWRRARALARTASCSSTSARSGATMSSAAALRLAGTGASEGYLARGAFQRRRSANLRRAREPQPQRAARRRRGRRTTFIWRAT